MSLSISSVGQQGATLPAARVKPAVAEARQETDTPAEDKVTLGGRPAEPLTYGSKGGKVTQSELAGMIEESDRKAQQVMDLIRPLVEQQGLNFAKVVSGEQQLQADPEAIEAARAAIAEGGEFSVEKTSERILSFARAMIGADPSKMDTIRAAVEKGFQQAQDMLGGSLPEISQKTLAAVQAGFDQWQKDGIPTD